METSTKGSTASGETQLLASDLRSSSTQTKAGAPSKQLTGLMRRSEQPAHQLRRQRTFAATNARSQLACEFLRVPSAFPPIRRKGGSESGKRRQILRNRPGR